MKSKLPSGIMRDIWQRSGFVASLMMFPKARGVLTVVRWIELDVDIVVNSILKVGI